MCLCSQRSIFSPDEWRDAIYSRIVKKVGSRLYWDDWSEDIASIAARYISLIDSLLDIQSHKEHFETFVTELRETLNPSIDRAQAVEMLAQHLITKPLFDAMFDDQQFTAQNPVSQAMQAILDLLAQNKVFELERRPLDDFYQTMVGKIRQIDNLAGKQQIMVTLFDRFFAKAFPRLADRLGIVFTPVEVVDYLIHSANQVLFDCFGKTFSNPGVAVIEPFVGTGTFVARLLQSGLISADQLEHKYRNEIFANEIVLLSYYIASINIENVYRQIRLDQGFDDGYVNFPGISLVDTFQLNEKDNDDVIVGTNPGFEANLARAARQQEADIRVVLMNPPYSVGQASANDDNQNLRYPVVDAAIERSYVARSTGTNKNSLYDSYFRALRWASNRIKEHGVIAFVSNSSFIDGNTADGVRLSLMEEFSHIYLYNMKGNARSSGELRRQEAGNVFGEGSRTGVALTVLVKQPGHVGPAQIHYAEVPDYASRREKLDILAAEESIAGTSFELITLTRQGIG